MSSSKIYYLVLVEKSNDRNNQSCIHMWKIIITYPDDDNESISMNNFNNTNEWLVQVQSYKVKFEIENIFIKKNEDKCFIG